MKEKIVLLSIEIAKKPKILSKMNGYKMCTAFIYHNNIDQHLEKQNYIK